jgi:signal transduction histidine kinase
MAAAELKILAVDDNQDNLTVLKAVVTDRLPGARLLTAPDGPRGIELAGTEDPDVILLDILMPGMDGYAVCRKLKEDKRLQAIPVVFLTALGSDRQSRVRALEVGAEGFITKPFDEIELIAQIRAMAKIKAANRRQRLEKEHLEALVAERTRELEQELAERNRAEEEREKLRAQLYQAQKIESVGRLAGGVAHDFNNMLGVIIGYTEQALEGLNTGTPMHDNLMEIGRAARRSADLTRQLLAFARKQTIDPEVLNLNETIEGILKMIRRLIGENIELVWHGGTGLWPVMMDPAQVDQILANLCVNARDAIAGTGKITIETHNSVFDQAYCADHPDFIPGEYVQLAVSDDGCGMDQETLARLFEPFFTTKEVGKGTGLGLATVYGIVRQNNGFIKVSSEPGMGSTFMFYLPRESTQVGQARPEPTVGQIVRGRETILLVEDEPMLLQMAARMLVRHGYTVLPAAAPGEAIRLAGEHEGHINLLMTDVVMPEMNGRELANKLLALYPGLKCLFMSGYTANVIAHHGVLDRNVHFIQKPFSVRDMAARVRTVLESG